MRCFLWIDGKEEGPFSLQEIQDRVAHEGCPPGTLVRGEGDADWRPLESVLGQTRTAVADPGPGDPGRSRRGQIRLVVTLVILGLVGLGIWQITRTKIWAEVLAMLVGVAGLGGVAAVLVLVTIWAVLWTLFPVFVFFFLQDIRDELRLIRRQR